MKQLNTKIITRTSNFTNLFYQSLLHHFYMKNRLNMNQTASNQLMMIVYFLITCSLPDLVFSFYQARDQAPKCEIKNHPYVAALTRLELDGRYYHYGAAVLITTEWLITSKNKAIEDYSLVTDPKAYRVLVGSNFELPTPETSNQSRYIKALHSFKSYAKAKIGPLFVPDFYKYRAEFAVYLIKVDRPFVLNEYVRPVKLPPRPDFVDNCGDNAIIVGWGQIDDDNTPKDKHWKSVNYSEPDHLKCAKANVTLPNDSTDDNRFLSEPQERYNIVFCDDDESVPIVCKDTLIGLLNNVSTLKIEGIPCFFNGPVVAINISYLMTFVREVAGVQVAFESRLKIFDKPTTKASTGIFGWGPAITSPDPEFGFILSAGEDKRSSCSLWMILTWTVVVFKIIK